MIFLAWLILFTPLAAAFTITFAAFKHPKLSSHIACAGIVLSFVSSLIILFLMAAHNFQPVEISVDLIALDTFHLEFGVLLDKLSCVMLLVVTGISSGIFFYSTEYMHGDPGFSRYFASLSLFAFSMLGIVLSNNFAQTFIFWELVGASSYLLIGHWFEKDSAAEASKKAFITTRVGDVGFLLGILLVWTAASGKGSQTLNFLRLEELFGSGAEGVVFTAIGLLIFCGVLGKSAQFPLHVWLPDAMEGPTPVSALIHAATMVAAGVYLLARCFFLISISQTALFIIACVGCLTAFLAATVALVQDDIKKILAYSTLSQLGFMVMALGLGSSSAGMYHLTTHAFFKALLFLGSGSVIHALHTQNIWDMGGLFKKMPVTSWTFLLGFLALAGVFPLSGFWSKDEILTLAAGANPFFFVMGSITAFLTAFYMGRLFFTVFMGEPKKDSHPHESPKVMTVPLMVLAFFSVVSGFFGLGHFFHAHYDVEVEWNFMVVLSSTVIALTGILLSYLVYGLSIPLFGGVKKVLSPVNRLLLNKYYMDDAYDVLVKYVQQNFAKLCDLFETYVIVRFAVNGTAKVTGLVGNGIRYFQTGKIQFYALVISLGVTLLTYVMIIMGRV